MVLFEDKQIGVIGGGNMTKSILLPLVKKEMVKAESIIVSDIKEINLESWKELGCQTTQQNGEVLATCDVIIWGIKPDVFTEVCEEFGESAPEMKLTSLHLSIMAGIPLDRFAKKLKTTFNSDDKYKLRFVRIMPNIGLECEIGCTVFALEGKKGLEEDRKLVESLFSPLGIIQEVKESKINAYCALFGSGIGFMFPIIEAMSDAAVNLGIPRDISLKLSAQVMKGAGELVLKSNSHPSQLKDRVCSPGGTTIAGLAELEKNGIRFGIMSAIEAAAKRGEAMAQNAQNKGILINKKVQLFEDALDGGYPGVGRRNPNFHQLREQYERQERHERRTSLQERIEYE